MIRSRFIAAWTAFLLIAVSVSAADAPKEAKDPSLDGTWKFVSGEYKGAPLPEGFIKLQDGVLTVKDTSWSEEAVSPINKKREKNDYILKFDLSATPGKLDLIDAKPDPGEEAKVQLAIYKIEGDVLTLCMARAGQERPKEFKSADKNVMVRVYKRVKP